MASISDLECDTAQRRSTRTCVTQQPALCHSPAEPSTSELGEPEASGHRQTTSPAVRQATEERKDPGPRRRRDRDASGTLRCRDRNRSPAGSHGWMDGWSRAPDDARGRSISTDRPRKAGACSAAHRPGDTPATALGLVFSPLGAPTRIPCLSGSLAGSFLTLLLKTKGIP